MPKPLKITHIIVSLSVGGAELALKRLVLSHKGNAAYQHRVISLKSLGTVGAQLQTAGVSVCTLNMGSALAMPVALWRLVSMLRKNQPDIVQTWMYHADLLGGVAARLAGIRNVIWGIRTTDVPSGGAGATAVVRKLCAWLSDAVPRTIVCAAEASRLAHMVLGYDGGRMVVVPNGFDLDQLVATSAQRAAMRQQWGLTSALVAVGYMGRFHREKDQRNFVRAAGVVAQQQPHARFVMVGRGVDTLNAELMQWIIATGFKDRFVLLGERSDVPVCLAAMDLFCLSSRTEGFPNVVAEAMALGLPCVVTNVGDAAMLVAGTGVVVPKEDSVALARGINQILALSAFERHQMGQQARARIHTKFSMARCTQRFEAIYQQMVNQ